METQLQRALEEMYRRESDYGKALDEEGAAEHHYKVSKAKAFLSAEGTERAREAESILATEKEYLAYLRAKAVAAFTKEKLKDIQQAVSARQTLVSSGARTNSLYTLPQAPG